MLGLCWKMLKKHFVVLYEGVESGENGLVGAEELVSSGPRLDQEVLQACALQAWSPVNLLR